MRTTNLPHDACDRFVRAFYSGSEPVPAHDPISQMPRNYVSALRVQITCYNLKLLTLIRPEEDCSQPAARGCRWAGRIILHDGWTRNLPNLHAVPAKTRPGIPLVVSLLAPMLLQYSHSCTTPKKMGGGLPSEQATAAEEEFVTRDASVAP